MGQRFNKCVVLVVVATVATSSIWATMPMALAADDYPTAWRSGAKDSSFDTWRMYNRECTSFAAWRLHTVNGFEMPFYDDADNWGERAARMGYIVDDEPAVGAVAWWKSGHVAWVEAVRGSLVDIEEYNQRYDGSYGRRTIEASKPTGYIHFKDVPPAQPIAAPEPTPAPTPILEPVADFGLSGTQTIAATATEPSASVAVPPVAGVQTPPTTTVTTATPPSAATSAAATFPVNPFLMSPNNGSMLTVEDNGDLVLYGPDHKVLWTSHAGGSVTELVAIRSDSMLVMRDDEGRVVWAAYMGYEKVTYIDVQVSKRTETTVPTVNPSWTAPDADEDDADDSDWNRPKATVREQDVSAPQVAADRPKATAAN